MGGKHKQAQRTKNNARPSSSGRSAELLGTSLNTFVGFSTVKNTGYIPPLPNMPFGSSSSSEEITANVDTNFQLVLKKMNKKDSVTKLKALLEFTELVTSNEPDAVKTILPFWPRLYSLLAVDVDHKVRTATHQAHQEVILKVKKNLAPYLKLLAGPWFTSQYDTYPPAATAATLSFEAAFPANKVQEAIVFCQEEILNYICDNITVQTVQTVCNPKTNTPEEAEAKYERLLIASLQGYTLYLSKLSADQLKLAEEINTRIISSSKFWKLSKNKVPLVRAAWFGCVTALCKNASFLLKNEEQNVTSTVFCNLDETEPTVLPVTWEAALYVISNIEDWWKFVNVEKLVLPKLWKILKEGGQGNACVVFPNILPLISHFPTTIDINLVYNNFFENMRVGLRKRNVIQSRSEFTAVATCITECIRYIIMKNVSNVELCESLVIAHLIPAIEWCLNDENSVTKVLFVETSTLLQYWTRNHTAPQFVNYKRYTDIFWINIEKKFEESLNKAEQNYEKDKFLLVAHKQIEFLFCLKKYDTCKHKKQVKVKFESPTRKLEETDTVDSSPSVNYPQGTYHTELNNLVHKSCALYLKYIEEKNRYELINCFCSLVQTFNTHELFKYLNTKLTNTESSVIFVYRNLFLKFLKQENITSQNIVDIVFILYNYLDQNEKNEVLESFEKLSNANCLRWSVAKALSHPYCNDQTVQTWLSNKKVTSLLIELANSMLTDKITPEEYLLLKQALQQNINGDLLISKEACKEIMLIFCGALLSPNQYPLTINLSASFAAQMSAILYTEKTLLSYGDQLVLALFSMSCNTNYDPETISEDTLWEISTAWQDVVMILTSERLTCEFENLAWKFAKILQNELLNNKETKMNQLIYVTVDLIKAVMNSKDSLGRKMSFVTSMLMVPEEIRKDLPLINNLFFCAEIIMGNISYPLECPVGTLECVGFVEMFKCFTWHLFIVKVIVKLYQKNVINGDEEEAEEEDAILSDSTKDTDDLMMSLLHFYTVTKSFTKYYKNTNSYYQISSLYDEFSKELHNFIKYILPSEILNSILEKFDYSKNNNIQFKVIFDLHKDLLDVTNLVEVYKKYIKRTSNEVEYIQLTQIFSNYLTCDEVTRKGGNLQLFITTKSLIHCEFIDIQMAEALSKFKDIQDKNMESLLYNVDVSNEPWENVQMVVEIIRFLESIVMNKYLSIINDQWDFIMMSITAWSDSVEKSKTKYYEMKTATFIGAICNLYTTFHKFIQNEELVKSLSPSCMNFASEYIELFAQDVHVSLLKTWIYIAERELLTQEHFYISQLPSLEIFGNIIFHLESKYMIRQNDLRLPKWQSIMQLCNSLIKSPENILQLYGYHCLKQIISELITIDMHSLESDQAPKNYGLMCSHLAKVLTSVQDVVQIMLMDLKLGEDSCHVEPFTDSYIFTFGYLLIWDTLLSLCQFASTDLRYQYSDWIRSGDYFKNLLNNIFLLMPTEVLHCTESKKQSMIKLFTTSPTFAFSELPNSEYLEHTVCWVYGRALSHLPAMVRQWWSDGDPRTAQVVEQVTATYVSPMLAAQELQDVIENEKHSKNNMKVKVHPSAREVIATYVVDEAKMEMIITLPINYPLGAVQVDCSKQIGGTTQWRNWVMQLTIFLTHQNGRIWDGLSLWKSNLDKKFDGVEECYICFAVLHNATYQLPKLVCQTCKKKFHSPCLYKWFSTSNKSTCPICRNLF